MALNIITLTKYFQIKLKNGGLIDCCLASNSKLFMHILQEIGTMDQLLSVTGKVWGQWSELSRDQQICANNVTTSTIFQNF